MCVDEEKCSTGGSIEWIIREGSGSQIYLPRSTSIERRSKSREPFDPTSAGEGVMTFA